MYFYVLKKITKEKKACPDRDLNPGNRIRNPT
jgi:hypothetical protein